MQMTKGYSLLLLASMVVPLWAAQVQQEEPALIVAANSHNLQEVQKLLRDPHVSVNIQNQFGMTALMKACTTGDEKVAFALLANQEIDVNIQSRYGDTALMWAVRMELVNIVGALLANPHIDINIQNNEDETALDIARSLARKPVIAVIEEYLRAIPVHPEQHVNK